MIRANENSRPLDGLRTDCGALDGGGTEPEVLAVCVCTYRRQEMLARCLDGLRSLRTPQGMTLELRVCDNDVEQSGLKTVKLFSESQETFRSVVYTVEGQRNIALARNRCVDLGPASLFAFIDDDEVPDQDWLIELVARRDDLDVDIVIGQVCADFASPPPSWVLRSRVFEKDVSTSLEQTRWQAARTANALVAGEWFCRRGMRFRREYGGTGGEDTDLFRRMVMDGARIGFAPGAVVRERILAIQCRVGWLWRRRWRSGEVYERLHAGGSLRRFVSRVAVATSRLVIGLPGALFGNPRCALEGALGFATALGGMTVWLFPARAAGSSSSYQSAGCDVQSPYREDL